MMADQSNAVVKLFLYPGNLVCDLTGVANDSDHRQVLRSFINMIVWSAIGSCFVLWAFL